MLNLEDIINNSDDVRELKRALVVNMSDEGMDVSDICKGLRVSDSYVSKWKIIYEKEGAEGLLIKYKGSKSYLCTESRKEIIGYIENCEHISTEELRDHIEEKYGVVYKSKQSYYDLLKAAGKSWHKSQKKNPKKNEERVILRREEIKKKLAECEEEIRSGKLYVFAEDESHLLWGDTLGYVWGNRNERIEIPIKNERERQTYYGAVDLHSGEFLLRAYDRAESVNTVRFLKYLQNQRKGAKLLIIWDMATYHRYAEMKEYLDEINKGLEEKDWKITCIFFEPNAPEQNPVEDIWLKGKNFLRKHFYKNKTFAQVKKCFFNFLSRQFFNFDKLKWYVPQFI